MTGEFDYLLKPIRPDAPRDLLRRNDLDDVIARKMRKVATLTSPPPTPPERGGGNPRVRIEIEINQNGTQVRQQGSRQLGRWRLAALIWAVVALVAVLAASGKSHGQTTWTSQREGFLTRSQGSDGSSATSYQQGFMRYTDITLPDGAVRHCESYKQDWQTITNCNP